MKSVFILAFTLAINVFASQGRGGGDPCENRIKTIRDDIRSWIDRGGSAGLKLPEGMSQQTYDAGMTAQIDVAQIVCVGPGDKGYPVEVDGVPKMCRFDRDYNYRTTVTCDIEKVKATLDPDLYVVVHHEFAGLASLENPNGSDSTYLISNQISEFLVDQVVKKLAVKTYSTGSQRIWVSSVLRERVRKCAEPMFRGLSKQISNSKLVEFDFNSESYIIFKDKSYIFIPEASFRYANGTEVSASLDKNAVQNRVTVVTSQKTLYFKILGELLPHFRMTKVQEAYDRFGERDYPNDLILDAQIIIPGGEPSADTPLINVYTKQATSLTLDLQAYVNCLAAP